MHGRQDELSEKTQRDGNKRQGYYCYDQKMTHKLNYHTHGSPIRNDRLSFTVDRDTTQVLHKDTLIRVESLTGMSGTVE
jgi:hypothetical protein